MRNYIVKITISFFFLLVQLPMRKEEVQNDIYRIKLNEYDYMFFPNSKCIDTISAKISSGYKIKLYLFDCKGKMKVECFNKKSILIEKGSYSNSLDLLKKYVYAIKVGTGNGKKKAVLKVLSYYQPLRTGIWLFYTDRGKLRMRKRFEKGILLDSLVIK